MFFFCFPRFNQNYGTNGLMDWIHGTNCNYKKNMQSKCDFFIMGLSSAREVVSSQGFVNKKVK